MMTGILIRRRGKFLGLTPLMRWALAVGRWPLAVGRWPLGVGR
jgi:hypothetical protein